MVSTEKSGSTKGRSKTETPAKEQASQAEVKENAKDSKNEAKTEETVSEVKAPETEVKSEESEVKEAEKKQILPIKNLKINQLILRKSN